jgi:excisionase family DNA binding protein
MILDEALRALIRDEVASVVRKEIREALKDLSLSSPGQRAQLLTIKEAAALASVSPGTIRGWISRGELKRLGNGRIVRILQDDLLKLLSATSDTNRPVSENDLDEQATRLLSQPTGKNPRSR